MSHVGKPPPSTYNVRDHVRYKQGALNFLGRVEDVKWKNGKHIYTISMNQYNPRASPTLYHNCTETYMSLDESSHPSLQHHNEPEDYSLSTTEEEERNESNTTTEQGGPLADNEYKLHSSNTVKRVNAYNMLKHAKDWPITLIDKDDLRKVYNRLKNYFGYYNIRVRVTLTLTS